MCGRGTLVLAAVLVLTAGGLSQAFKFKKKGKSSRPPPKVIHIPCLVQTKYITSYVKDYRQVPVYVTQVVPEVAADVVLKTLYSTRQLPLVVTQPKIVYVTRTAQLNVATTEVKFLPKASVDYEPIGVSHTAHIPVTHTDTRISTKTIKNTSYVTRLVTSYTTGVVTTTRIKTKLYISTTLVRTTELLTNTVLRAKTLCLEESFRRGVNNIIAEGLGGLIGTYDSAAVGGGGVYAGRNFQLQGSYGNRIH